MYQFPDRGTWYYIASIWSRGCPLTGAPEPTFIVPLTIQCAPGCTPDLEIVARHLLQLHALPFAELVRFVDGYGNIHDLEHMSAEVA